MDNASLKRFYKEFPNDEVCLDYLDKQRWPKNRACPHCGGQKIYEYNGTKLSKCAGCKKQFTPKTGTMFSDSHISMQDWFLAVQMLTSSNKPISSVQLAAELDVTQKTAWHMLQRIRSATNNEAADTQAASPTAVYKNSSSGRTRRAQPYKLESSFRAVVQRLVTTPKPIRDKKRLSNSQNNSH